MAYGIEVYKDDNIVNLSATLLSGRVFVGFVELASSASQTYTYTDIEGGANLIYYVIDGGAHDITKGGTTQATLTLSNANRTVSTENLSQTTKLAIFAKKITEPSVGVSLENDNGEKIASSNYPVPVYQGKITLPTSPDTTGGTTVFPQITRKTHSVVSSLGANTNRIVLWTLPENTNNVWFSGTSFIPSTVTNATVSGSFYIFDASTPAYSLPEGFIFSLGSFSASGLSHGFQLFNENGTLIFDSGLHHIGIKAFQDFSFPGGTIPQQIASSGTSVNASTTLFSGTNQAAILLPDYWAEEITAVGERQYTGVFRRQGGTLYTRLAMSFYNNETGLSPSTSNFGVTTNTTMAVDVSLLGGAAVSPLSADIVLSPGGTTTCQYDGTSGCTTSQTFTINVAGGDGTAISYKWALSGATGFTIPAADTGSSITVTNSSGAGVYSGGSITCTVSQGGSSLPLLTYALSHTHTSTPLSGGTITSNNVVQCDYISPDTSCTTTEQLTISGITGGNGNAKSYQWSFISTSHAGVFTIVNPNSVTASIVSTGAALAGGASYTYSAQCVVSQDGSTTSLTDGTLSRTVSTGTRSHIHNTITGNVESQIPNLQGATYADSVTANAVGTFVQDYMKITVTPTGLVHLTNSNNPNFTEAFTSKWWSTASFVSPVNLSGKYYIKVTRTANATVTGPTGTGSPISSSTGSDSDWVLLDSNKVIEVTAKQGERLVADPDQFRTISAPYKIEISKLASGSYTILSTTTFTLSASAKNTAIDTGGQ